MKEIDWIELWLLNRTIIMECKLQYLIHDVTQEHFGFWSFPERYVMLADPSTRTEALRRCVSQGFIKLYSEDWLQSSQIGQDDGLSVDQYDLYDPVFLEQTQAFATFAGHVQWEAVFQPDWRRYWQTDGTVNSSIEEAVLYVTYAGNEIFQELIQWLPDYFGFDREFGLQELGYKTYFQYQATKWKLLPFVKVAAWKTKLDNSLNTIAELAKRTDESSKQKLREQMGSCFWDFSERQKRAHRILNRLSGKWDTVSELDGGRYDTIPKLRKATP